VMFFNYNIVCVVVVSLCLDLYLCLFSYVLILITFVIKKKSDASKYHHPLL